tara:strand:+ start:1494 stop:1976 length:483 start_codon:yes stop_codon:yes gene_type:complete
MDKDIKISKKRHIAKTITWRIVGSLDTWIISWMLIHWFGQNNSHEATQGATYIALLELLSKTVLYYFHERAWYSFRWMSYNQRVRHVVKTFSWRLIGAMDTILLVYIVFYFSFGSTEGAAEIALSMFSIEIITKMILYYLHERVWFMSNYGVVKIRNQDS